MNRRAILFLILAVAGLASITGQPQNAFFQSTYLPISFGDFVYRLNTNAPGNEVTTNGGPSSFTTVAASGDITASSGIVLGGVRNTSWPAGGSGSQTFSTNAWQGQTNFQNYAAVTNLLTASNIQSGAITVTNGGGFGPQYGDANGMTNALTTTLGTLIVSNVEPVKIDYSLMSIGGSSVPQGGYESAGTAIGTAAAISMVSNPGLYHAAVVSFTAGSANWTNASFAEGVTYTSTGSNGYPANLEFSFTCAFPTTNANLSEFLAFNSASITATALGQAGMGSGGPSGFGFFGDTNGVLNVFSRNSGSAAITTISTGVNIGTNMHRYGGILFDNASNIVFTLDFKTVATVGSNLPPPLTLVRLVAMQQATNNAAAPIVHFQNWHNKVLPN